MARANGEGSEPRKNKKGLYEANYAVYVDGVPKLKSVYGKTKPECNRKLREALVARDGGLAVDPKNLTVKTFLESWLEDSVKGSVRIRTYDDYRWCVEKHVVPDLGRVKLDRLNSMQVQGLYSKKLKTLSGESVLHIHRTLRRALNQAVHWRLVLRNSIEDVDPPRKQKRPATVLSGEDVLRFVEVSGTRRHFPLYVLDALAGLRSGEILGLRWDDLRRDREGPLLDVRRRLLNSSECLALEEGTKTGRGMVIRLPELGEAVLRIHRKRQLEERLKAGPAWEEQGLVFTTRQGRWIHPNNISGYLAKDLAAAGLPKVRFHDLRHHHGPGRRAHHGDRRHARPLQPHHHLHHLHALRPGHAKHGREAPQRDVPRLPRRGPRGAAGGHVRGPRRAQFGPRYGTVMVLARGTADILLQNAG